MPNFDEIALIEMEETYPSRLARLAELQQKYPDGTLSSMSEEQGAPLTWAEQCSANIELNELLISERWFAPEFQRLRFTWMQLWPDLHRQEKANWERRLAEHRAEGKEMEELWEVWDALPHIGGATA